MKLLYLSREDVERLGVGMAEIVSWVEKAFVEKGNGRIEMPPKPGIHPAGDAFIHAMPAWIPAMGSAGVKWVSGFPQNQERGLPYITGLLVLNDPETGFPISVMDCTWVTAVRTGAATAVAARYLARPDSQTVGICGCGVQGQSNLQALHVVLPDLRRVYAYDIVPERARAYASSMQVRLGLEVTPVESPRAAVEPADVIVTAGPILKHPEPAIPAAWLKPGVFCSPVDFDSYFQPSALQAVDKFCTDDVDQLRYYQKIGYFAGIPPVYADLGQVVTGRVPGRQTQTERTMSMNLGIALEDMAVAIQVYRLAKERGAGTWLPL